MDASIVTEWLPVVKEIIYFKPLWVLCIVFLATQSGKYAIANLAAKDVFKFTLAVRGLAIIVGAAGGALLFEGPIGESAFAGAAIGAFTIVAYNLATFVLNRESSPAWAKSFAAWLSGKV